MKFTFRFYEQSSAVKTPYLPPLTLDLPSIEDARSKAEVMTNLKKTAHIAVEIDSEDGSTSERWYRGINGWKRSDEQRQP